MVINWGIRAIQGNIGISFEIVVLFVLCFGCLFFMARDFRLGAIMLLVISSTTFMGTFALGLNYVPAIIIMFISVVLMAFSLYGSGRDAAIGGLI